MYKPLIYIFFDIRRVRENNESLFPALCDELCNKPEKDYLEAGKEKDKGKLAKVAGNGSKHLVEAIG